VKITLDWLVQRDACATAREAFARRFPEGATYVEVQAALHAEHRADWSWWLVDAIYRDLLENPAEVTTQSVGAHVDISNKIIAASPLAVIETPTTDAARIGSSGDAARIGSSGYAAQIGSSGDDARIVATGENATIACAGIGARVKAGRNGCFALTWYDGNRNRIVVGYVGEDGIKADTWYRVEAGKLVEAA
jgi:hypothetical protein